MKHLLMGILLAVGLAGPAYAEKTTGNVLHAACQQPAGHDKGFCFGYVLAVGLARPDLICPPVGSTVGQGTDVVLAYLTANPAIRHRPANQLIIEALEKAWACNIVGEKNVNPNALTGEALLRMCRSKGHDAGYCLGYVMGVADGDPKVCVPAGGTGQQATSIVVGYVNSSPPLRKKTVGDLVPEALIKAWPCPK